VAAQLESSPATKTKLKKNKKTRKLGSPEQEAAREERIQKNENAKIRSYVRRLHLGSYVGENGLLNGAASIAQSLYRRVHARMYAAKKRHQRANRSHRRKNRDEDDERMNVFLHSHFFEFSPPALPPARDSQVCEFSYFFSA
jgi:hypothetical protein